MANDFSADANCIAVWDMEQDMVDSQGEGAAYNTLSEEGAPSFAADAQEGSYSVDLNGSDEYGNITDANLTANFPLKSGSGQEKISVCGWFKCDDLSNTPYIFAKYGTGTSANRSFAIFLSTNGDLVCNVGTGTGGSFESFYQSGPDDSEWINEGTWYHFGVTWDNSDATWQMIIWEDGTGEIVDNSGDWAWDIALTTAPLHIGARTSSGSITNHFDGHIDEVVVFNDILTNAEIVAIRGGTFPAVAFDSSFECGNGTNYSESPVGTFNVVTEADNPGTATWGDTFYFKLSGVIGKSLIVKVDFDNDRGSGPFDTDWETQLPWYSYDQSTWVQVSSTSAASEILTFAVPNAGNCTGDEIYVSMNHPYNYTGDLIDDVTVWGAHGDVTLNDLGDSSDGRNMYHLEIGSGSNVLALTCRTHPAEPFGSWALKGAIDWLISAAGNTLRAASTVHVFPMVNPDGVVAGRYRALDNGEDANRDYDNSGPDNTDEEDETFLIHTEIETWDEDIDLLVDLHSSVGEPHFWYDSTDFSAWSDLKTEIETQIAAADTNDIFNDGSPDLFIHHANQTDVVNTTWRSGVFHQYTKATFTMEGGYNLSKADMLEAGEVLIEGLLSALNAGAGGASPSPRTNFQGPLVGPLGGPI